MSTKYTWKIAVAATLGAIAISPVAAEGNSEAVRISRAELLARVAKTDGGLATSTLPTSPNAIAIEVQRQISGEVEIHDTLEDIFVAQAGHATVIVGTATGTRNTAPGEWRGGAIKETRRYELAPGDVLWIPAGLPHQMLLPARKTFHYLALKFSAKPAP
jgi:mannose-6-phosphate isomerase-like protein (cupin superfamily)